MAQLHVMKASAGSGKTYQLARKYIELLISKKTETGRQKLVSASSYKEFHEHILAITFTNAATNEMKQRIINELYKLSNKKGDHVKYFQELLGEDIEKIAAVAKKALEQLLFSYTTFKVSTIDAFFQSILRAFAYDLELDSNYNLELGDELPMKFAVQSFLSRLSSGEIKNKIVKEWLQGYVDSKLKNAANSPSLSNDWNVFLSFAGEKSALLELSKELNKELFKKNAEAVNQYLSDINPVNKAEKEAMAKMSKNSRIAQFQRQITEKSEAKQQQFKEEAHGIWKDYEKLFDVADENKATNGAKKNKSRAMGTLIKAIANDTLDDYVTENHKKLLALPDDNSNCWFKSTTNSHKNAIDNPEVCRKLVERVKGLVTLWAESNLLQDIGKNLFVFGLLGLINDEMMNYRHDNNAVLIGDTNELLQKIIADNPTPFVYERVGMILRHFLIDEFQDTSEMQYRNLKALLDNSLSEQHDNLIIGDEKQSIYRFRNSNFELLHSSLKNDFGSLANIDTTMVTNWRSSKNVIGFNNFLFSEISNKIDVSDIYSNVAQKHSGKSMPEGHVRVNFVSSKTGKSIIGNLPSYINEILSRGYSFKDIAILVNKHTDGDKVVESILSHNASEGCERPINVLSNESLLLNKSESIRIIISNLRYYAISGIITKGQAEEKLYRMSRDFQTKLDDNPGNPGEALSQCFSEADQTNGELPKSDVPNSDSNEELSLVAIVERIIRNCLSPVARQDDCNYINAFQDLVLEFRGSKNASLHSFLRWWDKCSDKLSVLSPSNVDAIRVMTIHKSKGLEFPVVIIPKADWKIESEEDKFWALKENLIKTEQLKDIPEKIFPPFVQIKNSYAKYLPEIYALNATERLNSRIDNLNKTYVGFTRAQHEMHIFAPISEKAVNGTKEDDGNTDIAELLHEVLNGDNQMEGISMSERNFESEDGIIYTATLGEPSVAAKVTESGKKTDLDLPQFEEEEVTEKDYKPFSRFLTVNIESMSLEQEFGIKVHNLMCKIKTDADLQRVMLWAEKRGHFGEHLERVKKMVEMVVESQPELYAKGVKVYNELSIYNPENKESRRPDRIVELPGGELVVIDYKVSEHIGAEKHKRQVKGYCEALKSMGHKVGRGLLCYISDEKVAWVEAE